MIQHSAKILIIEDDAAIRCFLRVSLEAENFNVFEADTAAEGLAEARRHRPDLYLIDLGLPDRDGQTVIRELRTWTQQPVIVLSARTQETEKIAALDAGADDYLTKPFNTGELKARIRVAFRHRTPTSAGDALRLGDVCIDLEARRVTKAEKDIHLTAIEYRLLEALAKHPGKVLTQRTLLTQVWGHSHTEDTHYLRIYMKHLRRKIEPDPSMPRFLITETGVGYRLVTS
jgi:two-component system, OmpR family, KDP operon response regulator KdpE